MALTLLRHTTPAVAPGICYGRTDLALADTFEAEARAVIASLPATGCILTSPLTRCQRLADRIAVETEHEVRIATDWMEMDFGRWEGMPWEAVPRGELDAWAADFHGYDGHGGESVTRLETRIRRALDKAPDGALIVTHAGCIKAAMAILGQGDGWQTQTPYGAPVTLRA